MRAVDENNNVCWQHKKFHKSPKTKSFKKHLSNDGFVGIKEIYNQILKGLDLPSLFEIMTTNKNLKDSVKLLLPEIIDNYVNTINDYIFKNKNL